LSFTLLSIRKKGLLVQALPLDFLVHPHQPGDHVLIKTWKENKLETAWEGCFLVLLTHGNSCLDHGEGVDSSHMHKEGTPQPDQKEQWTIFSHPGNTKVTLERL
jgi:hypothetical protein